MAASIGRGVKLGRPGRQGLRRCLAAALITGLVATSSVAWAGGVLVAEEGASPAIDAARALLVWRADRVAMQVQLEVVSGGAEQALWLLPVPPGAELGVGDEAIFDDLEGLTAPLVTILGDAPDEGPGCCGETDQAGKRPWQGETWSASPFEGALDEAYAFGLLERNEAKQIATWLEDRGVVASAEVVEALEAHAEAGLTFAWAELGPLTTEAEAVELRPLTVEFERPVDPRQVYPLGVARASASSPLSFVLYVLADKRTFAANYPATDLQGMALGIRDIFDAAGEVQYDRALDALTEDGAGRLLVTEFARDVGDRDELAALVDDDARILTRLHGRLHAEALEDVVLAGTKDGPEVSPNIEAKAGPPAEPKRAALAWLLILLAALGVVGLHRER